MKYEIEKITGQTEIKTKTNKERQIQTKKRNEQPHKQRKKQN